MRDDGICLRCTKPFELGDICDTIVISAAPGPPGLAFGVVHRLCSPAETTSDDESEWKHTLFMGAMGQAIHERLEADGRFESTDYDWPLLERVFDEGWKWSRWHGGTR